MSKPMVVITKEEYDRLLRYERMVMTYFEHQQAQYNQTMQCQMAQQAINIVTQQIQQS